MGMAVATSTGEANKMIGDNALLFLLLCSSGTALRMIGPSTHTASIGSIAHIPCTFTDDKLPADPKYFAVFWYLNGKKILSYDNTVTSTDPRYTLDEDRALNGIADLTISNTFLSDGGEFLCSVTYSPFQVDKRIKVEISGTALQMTGPSTHTASVGSIAHIPCTFTADQLPADPKYFAVFWYLKGKKILSYDNTVTSTDPRYTLEEDRALNGIADLTISNTSISDDGVFTCSVNYSSLLMKKEIRVDILAKPSLSIPSKSFQRNTENTLTCMATGFFPSDIDIIWYKDGEVLENQLMGEPQINNKGTYEVNSTVRIPPSDDDHNKNFSCRIKHVSLQEPLQMDIKPTYEESSSHVVTIISAVAVMVVILAGIGIIFIGIILWKRKPCKKGEAGRQGPGSPEQPLLSNKNVTPARSFLRKENPNTPERPPPDPEVGEITVPELIKGKTAVLSCKVNNYILGIHDFSWHVKLKSTGDITHATYDGKKNQTIEKDETSDDQNTRIAYLTLQPVQESDDGSEIILRVGRSGGEIERSTGPIHVKRILRDPGKGKNNLDESIEKEKDKCAGFGIADISAESSKPPSSDQQQTHKPHTEICDEKPQCPVNVEKEDNTETASAMDSSSSELEEGDKKDSTNLDNMEKEDLTQNSSHSSYAEENMGDQSLESKKPEQEEHIDNDLPIDVSSSKLEEGDKKEISNINNMEKEDLTQNSSHSSYAEENIGDQSLESKQPEQEEDIDNDLPIDVSSSKLEEGDKKEFSNIDNMEKDLTPNRSHSP